MNNRLLVGMLLLGARAVAADEPPRSVPLDFGRLAENTATVGWSPAIGKAIAGRHPPGESHVVAIDASTMAVPWSHCDEDGCKEVAVVSLLKGSREHPRVIRRARLSPPVRVWPNAGVRIDKPALFDLDGDGRPELLVRLAVDEPPRRALGSKHHVYVLALTLPKLGIAWSHELASAGDVTEDRCEWTVALRPGGAGADPGLEAGGACGRDSVFDETIRRTVDCWSEERTAACPPVRRLSMERYFWDRAAHAFRPVRPR